MFYMLLSISLSSSVQRMANQASSILLFLLSTVFHRINGNDHEKFHLKSSEIKKNKTEFEKRFFALPCYSCSWKGRYTSISALFSSHDLTKISDIYRGLDKTAKKAYFCIPFNQCRKKANYLLFVLNETDAENIFYTISEYDILAPFSENLRSDDIMQSLNDFLMARAGPTYVLPKNKNASNDHKYYKVDMLIAVIERELHAIACELFICMVCSGCMAKSLPISEDTQMNLTNAIRGLSFTALLWTGSTKKMRRFLICVAVFAGTFWY